MLVGVYYYIHHIVVGVVLDVVEEFEDEEVFDIRLVDHNHLVADHSLLVVLVDHNHLDILRIVVVDYTTFYFFKFVENKRKKRKK
jgi:hypothetical protein